MESYNDLFLQMVSKLDDWSLLGPILTKFQLCWFSGLFWAFSLVKSEQNQIAFCMQMMQFPIKIQVYES